MKPGEILVVLLVSVCAAGVFITALHPGPDSSLLSTRTNGETPDAIPVGPLDLLSQGCSGLIYGNLPRQSFAGDTTILTMDLDIGLYTVTQANLTLTRLLRGCGITLHQTRQRPDGGLTFFASLPDGEPLRLELKASR
jgi:hypothetical protein